jgi:aspartate racemase
MPQHIGIVACSAEGAALCYRTICVEGEQLLGRHAHPEVSMHTPSLAGMGADFLICPDNTIHQALPNVVPRSPLPWLHIADAVMGEAAARGYGRVGLTGTKWLMEGPVYPAALVRPAPAEREEMNRIIMDELVCGVFKPAAIAFFQQTISSMKTAGCDAVVLGCTEIPLLMSDSNSPLPTLDSTRLLARAALHLSHKAQLAAVESRASR